MVYAEAFTELVPASRPINTGWPIRMLELEASYAQVVSGSRSQASLTLAFWAFAFQFVPTARLGRVWPSFVNEASTVAAITSRSAGRE